MKDKENQVFGGYGNHDFPTEIKQERFNNTTSQSEKIVYGSLITSTKCYNCIHFPLCFAQKGGANLELASENDCCYYQLKLPEDSVVLSREEYEDYKKHIDNCVEEYHRGQHEAEVYYKNIQIPRERKETAEKIYLQAKAIVDATKHIVQGREYIHIDALKEIIKNCGGEIEE